MLLWPFAKVEKGCLFFFTFLEVVWAEGVQFAGVICLPVEQEPRGLCQLALDRLGKNAQEYCVKEYFVLLIW